MTERTPTEELRAIEAELDQMAEDVIYGSPCSPDARLFTPDPEVCTAEELAAHAAALAALERGEPVPAKEPSWIEHDSPDAAHAYVKAQIEAGADAGSVSGSCRSSCA